MAALELLCWCISLTILIAISVGAVAAAVGDILRFGRNGDFELLFGSLACLAGSVMILALKLGLIR